jgi:class I fructose-bisphosphate aldolase
MNERVREILSWYGSDNPGVLTNLARMLNHGRLGGTGKMVILPVDQGFEHGPARSFAPNPAGYDPRYHFELGVAAGCNAYAAPLGFLEAGAPDFAGDIPLILKLNNSDSLAKGEPCSALTGSVDEALRLGCSAIGFTIYPASSLRNVMFQELRDLTEEAKRKGLVVVVWSYPRGTGLSKEGETAIDVVAYAAQIAAQLGAHVIKVKPPTAHIEQDAARKVYEKEKIPIGTLAERVRHVVQACFGVTLTLVALSRSLYLTYFLLFIGGIAMMIVVSRKDEMGQFVAPLPLLVLGWFATVCMAAAAITMIALGVLTAFA